MNIVCICLDTFRPDIVGSNKKLSHCKTPNLDDLYRQSVAFEGAYGEGQPTLQCRRAFFTGHRSFPWRYNFDRRGHWHHAPGWHKIPPEQDTLAEVLTARGYCTSMVADAYHMFKPTMNYTRGFSSYDFVRGQESDNYRPVVPELVEEQMKNHVREPISWERHATLAQYLANQGDRQREEDYQCARVFRSACDRLEGLSAAAPFFLWIDSFDPHEPWDPPKKYADMYCPDYDGLDFVFPGAMHEGDGPTEQEIERTKALYLGEVTFVDKWIGMLMDRLEELKLMDDTIIMVLSDHGTEVYDHGTFGKKPRNQRPYTSRIVWYMRHPDGPAGQKIDAYVLSHDLMPTILELLDLEFELPGQSVMPLVRGETEKLRDYIVCGWAEWASGKAAGAATVRDDRWRYSVMTTQPDEQVLYDLQADEAEENDVLAEHPDVVRMQRDRIEKLLGQPLPAQYNEVCDPEPGPVHKFFSARGIRRREDEVPSENNV